MVVYVETRNIHTRFSTYEKDFSCFLLSDFHASVHSSVLMKLVFILHIFPS